MKPSVIKLTVTIIGIILAAISFILSVIFYAKLPDTSFVDVILKWAYFLAILAAVIAFVIVPIFQVIQNPKRAIKFLVSILIFAIIVLISYSMASSSGVENPGNIKNFELQVKLVDTGLIALYILSALGILAILFAEVKNIFK